MLKLLCFDCTIDVTLLMHVLLCMLTLDFICLMLSLQTSYTSIFRTAFLAFKVESNFASGFGSSRLSQIGVP